VAATLHLVLQFTRGMTNVSNWRTNAVFLSCRILLRWRNTSIGAFSPKAFGGVEV
jgi:hypothetical protein